MRSGLLLLVLVLSGCTSTKGSLADEGARKRLNVVAANRAVRVVLADGSVAEARLFRADRDSASWASRAGVVSTVPLADVRRVGFVTHGAGALDGLAVGALAGAGVGLVFNGIASKSCGDYDVICGSAPAHFGATAAVFSVLGALAGPLPGAFFGHQTVWKGPPAIRAPLAEPDRQLGNN